MTKFPFFHQLDAKDCGATCLRMIGKFYGKTFSQFYLSEQCRISRNGVSLLGISETAEQIGFRTTGIKLTWEQLRDEVYLPCIIHWSKNHFVIVYKIKRNKADDRKTLIYVADPAFGLVTYSKSEFLPLWINQSKELEQGIALLFETTPNFYAQGNDVEVDKKLKISYLLNYIRPYRRFVVQLFLGMLTGSLLSLIAPFLAKANIDYGILNNNYSFVILVIVSQLILAIGQTANGMIRSWIMLHVTTRVSISLISDFFIKLMKLPMSYFDVKLTGDILQRIGDHGRIQSFLTGTLINIIFSSLTFVIYSCLMASYDLNILAIFYVGSLIHVLWILLFMKKRKVLDHKYFKESSKHKGAVIQLINGMQEIKLNGCEKQKRWEWEIIRANLFKIRIKGLILGQNQQVGSFLINRTKNIFIALITAKAVIDGNMTLGMLVAVQYILGHLNGPIGQFIGFVHALQDAKISMERLGEIHQREDEDRIEQNKSSDIPEKIGFLIKNLDFGYDGLNGPKVINNLNLRIPSNKVTAIVGASGSGKTTLLKLLLGFYKPLRGDILLGNNDLHNYNMREWRMKCGVVMQEGFLFSDTIENNISVINEIADKKRIDVAVKQANIEEFIASLPMRLNTKIGMEGMGVSTGQKQRILIARAIYKDPSYIFLDEATNALDTSNEKIIMENMQDFFKDKTVVIVAHRLSTVKRADKIVLLDKGQIIEEGNHSELVAKQGGYYQLIKDQLELDK